MQSTNEELATTNEELQSLNEELENMNEELEHRTQELHQLSQRYAETLKSMPWPVALVDDTEQIQLWNAAAQRLFGVGETSVVGVGIDRLVMLLTNSHSIREVVFFPLLRAESAEPEPPELPDAATPGDPLAKSPK